MCGLTLARQAIARLVARLQLAEDKLKKAFTTKKDDTEALEEALQAAYKAGLTPVFSEVVRDVEAFIKNVINPALPTEKKNVDTTLPTEEKHVDTTQPTEKKEDTTLPTEDEEADAPKPGCIKALKQTLKC